MNKKYKLTSETIEFEGKKLYRIEALISFGNASKGDKGGFLENENNLAQSGEAWVSGNAKVCGEAKVCGDDDYIVFKNNWSSGRYFTWTKSNGMWRVGCFYGTGEELIKKAYQDSEESGKKYELYVNLTENLKGV